ELQVLRPVGGGVGEGRHLLGREREGHTVTLPGGHLELADDGRAVRPNGARHEPARSRGDATAASALDRRSATPTRRGVWTGGPDGSLRLPPAVPGISGAPAPGTVMSGAPRNARERGAAPARDE